MLTFAGGARTEEKRPNAKRPSVASTLLPIPDIVKCPLSVALSLLNFSYAISQPIHAASNQGELRFWNEKKNKLDIISPPRQTNTQDVATQFKVPNLAIDE